MAKIKSHTDLDQSRKLVEILPEESADMHYSLDIDFMEHETVPTVSKEDNHFELFQSDIPCWSLTALLNVLPDGTDVVKEKADTENERYMCTVLINDYFITTFASNPVDACYNMILRLHEITVGYFSNHSNSSIAI